MRIDDETVGGIVIFPRSGRLDGFDLLVAQKTVHALSAQLIRNHVAFRDASMYTCQELLERVLEGGWIDKPALRARAASLGWGPERALTRSCS